MDQSFQIFLVVVGTSVCVLAVAFGALFLLNKAVDQADQ
jgi:hypothetical protein